MKAAVTYDMGTMAALVTASGGAILLILAGFVVLLVIPKALVLPVKDFEHEIQCLKGLIR
jgi:hypothetical protein